MKKLKNKLRGQKSAMTREYGRLEEFISDYKQACDDGDPDSILKTMAQELVTSNEKMRNYREELESSSRELTQLMYSCQNNELENNSPEDAVNKVFEDVDRYVSKHKKLVKSNAVTIDKALAKITAPTIATAHPEIEQSHSYKDTFRSMADLRPAKLEKGTNVLEVLTWVEQVTNYIEAGYKNDPPDTGVFKFISPLLSDCWIQPLKQIRPETKKLKEITDAIEEEAKRNDPKHTRRVRSVSYTHLTLPTTSVV